MKILFLTPRDTKTNLGGVERHVRVLAEELVRRGHEVKELSLDEVNKSYKGYKNYKEKERGEKDQKDKKEKGKSQKDRKVGKFRAWKYLWDRRELLRWAEVIHVHDVFWWYAPFALIAKIAKISEKHEPRVFVTFHGWEGRCPPKRSAVWQKRLAAWLSDGTIGVGNFYRKWYGVKTDRVVWGAIDKSYKNYKEYKSFKERGKGEKEKEKKDQKEQRGEGKAAFLGRLEEVNGIGIVIEAIKKIIANDANQIKRMNANKRIGFKFIFVGDGSYRKPAESVGKVTGMVAEPWKYLADAEVVIASSYLAILEAAAMGKRIIAVANNSLKRDYLEGHPLRRYFKVVENAEELAGEIRDNSYKNYKDYKGKSWALGQTAEKLADEYEKLWRGGEMDKKEKAKKDKKDRREKDNTGEGKVSVIVTVKNDPAGERKLMEALAGQTVRPDEVVVVRAEEYGNCSRGRGRNIGVRMAKNEVIAVTDVGCRPHKDWLEKLYKCYKSYKSDKLVVAGWYRAEAKTDLQRIMTHFLVPVIEREEREQKEEKEKGKTQKDWRGEGKFLPASRSIMFTRKAWEAVAGYPEDAASGAEDLEFARRLSGHPDVKMIYCPQALVDWEPPATLGEFFRDIVKHTRGNVEVGYWPHLWRNLTAAGRWGIFMVFPWMIPIYLGIKVIKIINVIKADSNKETPWLTPRSLLLIPVVQVVADGGVVWGLGRGLVHKLIGWLPIFAIGNRRRIII